MDNATVLRTVQHYQKSIGKCQNDQERLLYCVRKLKGLPITVEHLTETGVGRTVNSLRKFDGHLGIAAGALVDAWKSLVLKEENEEQNSLDNTKQQQHYANNEQQNGMCVEHQPTEMPVIAANHQSGGSFTQAETKTIRIEERADKTRNGDTQHKSIEHHKHRHSHSHSSHSHSHSKDKHSSKNTHESLKSASKHKTSSSTSRSSSSSQKQYADEAESKQNSDEENTIKLEENSRHRHDERSSHRGEHRDKHHSKSGKDKHRDKEQSAHENHENHERKHDKKRKHDEENAHSDDEEENHKVKEPKHKKKKEDKHEEHRKKHKDHDRAKERNGDSSKHKSKKSGSSSKEYRTQRSSDNSDELEAVNVKVDKDQVDNDGIDSSMGANFADVLGMLNMPVKKSKKSTHSKSSTSPQKSHRESTASTSHGTSSSSKSLKTGGSTSAQASTSRSAHSSSFPTTNAKPQMLSSSAKLEPLDPSIALELPIIPNNYRPAPINPTVMECVYNAGSSTTAAPTAKPQARGMTDSEALTHSISSKTMRTKIYSGVKTGQILQVPSLFDLCIRLLQKNIDALEFTGGVPFEVLRPVLERASPMQLATFEEFNPYMMEDTDMLWQQHVQRQFRAEKRQEMESWREMYFRCQDDKERKLSKLAENIKKSQKEISAPVRKTQLAYVDSMVKPPRNVQRKQEQYGTKSKLIATPAARVAALQVVTPNAAKTGDARLRVASTMRDHAQVSSSGIRNKKAPLMAKTLQLMRGRHKR